MGRREPLVLWDFLPALGGLGAVVRVSKMDVRHRVALSNWLPPLDRVLASCLLLWCSEIFRGNSSHASAALLCPGRLLGIDS